MLTKLCPRCGQNKGINDYYRSEGGVHTLCKQCRISLFEFKPPHQI